MMNMKKKMEKRTAILIWAVFLTVVIVRIVQGGIFNIVYSLLMVGAYVAILSVIVGRISLLMKK